MALLARTMSSDDFGSYSFATSFLLFTSLFFDFGLFLPAARRIATANARSSREILGAALLTYAPVGLAFCLFTFAASYVVDPVFNVEAGHAIRLTSALALCYPFVLVGQQLAQGADRLHIYSLTSALAQVVFVVSLVLALALGITTTVTLGLALRGGGFLVGSLALIVWLKPRYAAMRQRVRALATDAKAYGFQVYVGRLFGIATYNMDVLMLAALTNPHEVAYYTIAGATARIVGLPVQGMASALFPRMTRDNRLDPRWITIAWAVGLVGFALCSVLARPFIELTFSSRYAQAATYLIPLAFAEVVRSVTTVYNSYLAAQARGAELRNAGLLLTVSNLVFNVALIPPFGGMGAAVASLIALLLNLGVHIMYYRRSAREFAKSAQHHT